MPTTTQQDQSTHVSHCTITLASPPTMSIKDQVVKALNDQRALRGEVISKYLVGGRVITSSAGFTARDNNAEAAATGLVVVAAATAYDAPATNFLEDMRLDGSGTAVIEVYHNLPDDKLYLIR